MNSNRLINIKLTNTNPQSNVQKEIELDSNFENNISNAIDDNNNAQIEVIWKKFLDSNPSIMIKLSKLKDNSNNSISNASIAGSLLISNGMYNEAKLWKTFRRNELDKIEKGI